MATSKRRHSPSGRWNFRADKPKQTPRSCMTAKQWPTKRCHRRGAGDAMRPYAAAWRLVQRNLALSRCEATVIQKLQPHWRGIELADHFAKKTYQAPSSWKLCGVMEPCPDDLTSCCEAHGVQLDDERVLSNWHIELRTITILAQAILLSRTDCCNKV